MIKIIWSRWNEIIGKFLVDAAVESAKAHGVSVSVVSVPGAYEIPLMLQHSLRDKNIQGAIVLGCLIRGETSHYDALISPTFSNIQKLSLEFNKPVANGILTVENLNQAFDRAGGKLGNKGREAMEVVLELCTKISNNSHATTLSNDVIQ